MALGSLNTAIICCIRALLLDEVQDVYMTAQEDEGSTHDSAGDGGSESPSQLQQMLPRSRQRKPKSKLLPSSSRSRRGIANCVQ